MPDTSVNAFLAIVAGRRGHFLLESGHHGGLWLELDALFADFAVIQPFVSALAGALKEHNPSMICGPLFGGAFLAQLVARELDVGFSFTDRIKSQVGTGLYHTRYRLPAAFNSRVRGQRIALVDDVMSAGSALRGTFIALHSQGAIPVAVGSLLQLGDAGLAYFQSKQIPVVAVARDSYDLWTPENCPLCAEAVPFESVASV